jgi:hypothetical protein
LAGETVIALFSGKLIIGLVLLVGVFGYGLGYFHWNKDGVKCFQKKWWQAGEWHTLYAVGRLEFRYKTINYDCDPDVKYDPSKYQIDATGEVTPKGESGFEDLP